jgi:hypothetical protein
MRYIVCFGTLLMAAIIAEAPVHSGASAADGGTTDPTIQKGVVGIRLRERGALLIENFQGDKVDEKKWRIWHSDPEAVQFSVRDGRFEIRGEGHLQHNGLWSLDAARFKDVTLVGRMNIQTEGANPHDLLLHLCGGDMPTSPDHWVEISMRDTGNGKARFGVFAAVEKGLFTERNKGVFLERGDENGFLARLSLNGSSNLCKTEVQDTKGKWHQIVKPIPLNLRTTHCEVKMRGGGAAEEGSSSTSVGWFEDVRIYPRATSHPILVRLVMRDGTQIFTRQGGSWPPKLQIGDEESRDLDDLLVELWTADGKTRISSVQSPNFAHYMLPLDHQGWSVFPVGAVVRVSCDGKPLGEAEIRLNELDGLYPDDVYDVLME